MTEPLPPSFGAPGWDMQLAVISVATRQLRALPASNGQFSEPCALATWSPDSKWVSSGPDGKTNANLESMRIGAYRIGTAPPPPR